MKIKPEKLKAYDRVLRRHDLWIPFEEYMSAHGGRPWEGKFWSAAKRLKTLHKGIDYTTLEVNGRQARFITRRGARVLDSWWDRRIAETASPLETAPRERPGWAEVDEEKILD